MENQPTIKEKIIEKIKNIGAIILNNWKKALIAIVILVFCLIYFFGYKSDSMDTYSLTSAYTGIIREKIEVSGKTRFVQEQKLSFGVGGKIKKINFKRGDKVKKGDVIAELDFKDLQNQIKQTEIAIKNSQLNLSKLYSATPESSKLTAKKNMEDSQNSYESLIRELELLKKDSTNQLKDLSGSIIEAQKNLESAKIGVEVASGDATINLAIQNLDSTTKSNQNQVTSSLINAKSYLNDSNDLLNFIDELLFISRNFTKYEQYQGNIGFKNQLLKGQTQNLFSEMRQNIGELNSQYDQIISEIPNPSIKSIDLINKILLNHVNMVKLANDSLQVILDTANSFGLDSLLATTNLNIQSSRNKLQSTSSILTTNLTQLTTQTPTELNDLSESTNILQKNQQLTNQQLALQKAENTLNSLTRKYNQLQSELQLKIDIKQNQVESQKLMAQITKKTYGELIDGPLYEDVGVLKNAVNQSQVTLDYNRNKLDDYKIIAPFDGEVISNDLKLGDFVSPSVPVVVVSNPKYVEIELVIDQIDIVKIKSGQKVDIIFDSHPDEKFEGKIREISSEPLEQAGVISYNVYADFMKEDELILPAMTVNTTIIVNEKNNALIIPTKIINYTGDISYVEIQNGKKIEIKEITQGIVDGVETEILKGVSISDKLIDRTFKAKTDTTSPAGTGRNQIQRESFGN